MPGVERAHGQVDVSIIMLGSASGAEGCGHPREGGRVVLPGEPTVAYSLAVVDVRAAVHAALPLLSDDEHQRAQRFRRPEDRSRYCIAHATLRSALAKRLGGDARQLRFTEGAAGKPRLAGHDAPVHFSVSYTTGMIAIALSARSVGVDVEVARDDVDIDGIARRFLAADEQARLARERGEQWRVRFYALWTRKEALAKACGRGFAAMIGCSAADEFAMAPDEDTGDPVRYAIRSLVPPIALPGCALAIACASDVHG
jgi:4'-phosphopantetheinyl transferase